MDRELLVLGYDVGPNSDETDMCGDTLRGVSIVDVPRPEKGNPSNSAHSNQSHQVQPLEVEDRSETMHFRANWECKQVIRCFKP